MTPDAGASTGHSRPRPSTSAGSRCRSAGSATPDNSPTGWCSCSPTPPTSSAAACVFVDGGSDAYFRADDWPRAGAGPAARCHTCGGPASSPREPTMIRRRWCAGRQRLSSPRRAIGCAGPGPDEPRRSSGPQTTTIEVSYDELLNQKQVARAVTLAVGDFLQVSLGVQRLDRLPVGPGHADLRPGGAGPDRPRDHRGRQAGRPGAAGREVWVLQAIGTGHRDGVHHATGGPGRAARRTAGRSPPNVTVAEPRESLPSLPSLAAYSGRVRIPYRVRAASRPPVCSWWARHWPAAAPPSTAWPPARGAAPAPNRISPPPGRPRPTGHTVDSHAQPPGGRHAGTRCQPAYVYIETKSGARPAARSRPTPSDANRSSPTRPPSTASRPTASRCPQAETTAGCSATSGPSPPSPIDYATY